MTLAGPEPGRGLPVASRWFDIAAIDDGIVRITEPHAHPYVRSTAWLVRGESGHVLADAGLGVGDLARELAGLLDRPVLAVATHAHFDHYGGLGGFADRAAHPADADVIESAADGVTLTSETFPAELVAEFEAAGEPVPRLLVDALPAADFDLGSFRTPAVSITRGLAAGEILDLGDRRLEVLHAPGHTPGSICLWEAASGTLIPGDVLLDGEPLQDEIPRASPADYAASLRRLADLPVSRVLPGHGPVFGRARAREIIRGYLCRHN